jgi:hypothetical protein
MTRFLYTTNYRHAVPVDEIERIDHGEKTVAVLKNGAKFNVDHHAVEELCATYVPAAAGQTVWIAHYNVDEDKGADSTENDAENGMFVYDAPVIAWRMLEGEGQPVLPEGVLEADTSGRNTTIRWAMKTAEGMVVDCWGSVYSDLESFKKDYLADHRRREARRAARS